MTKHGQLNQDHKRVLCPLGGRTVRRIIDHIYRLVVGTIHQQQPKVAVGSIIYALEPQFALDAPRRMLSVYCSLR